MLSTNNVYIVRVRKTRMRQAEYERALRAEGDSLPTLATMASLVVSLKKELFLSYREIGGRGHLIRGKTVKNMRNGLIFESLEGKAVYTFTELTYEEFNRRVRPHLSTEDSISLLSMDDVREYYHRQVMVP